MQKIIGVIMIFAGCTGLGVWYSRAFRGQIQVMKIWCRILELFVGEIRYSRCTLPECCMRVAKRTQPPYQELFMNIYMQSCENTGESFGDVCKRILEDGVAKENAAKEDKELFISCFVNDGYEEDFLQLRSLEQTKEELDKKVLALESVLASKCRLALSLGSMSGLLLIILLW